MKIKFIYIIMALVINFGFCEKVTANDFGYSTGGNENLVCSYKNNYYQFNIYYTRYYKNGVLDFDLEAGVGDANPKFLHTVYDNGVRYHIEETVARQNLYNDATCPTNVYTKSEGATRNVLCFDNGYYYENNKRVDGSWCKSKDSDFNLEGTASSNVDNVLKNGRDLNLCNNSDVCVPVCKYNHELNYAVIYYFLEDFESVVSYKKDSFYVTTTLSSSFRPLGNNERTEIDGYYFIKYLRKNGICPTNFYFEPNALNDFCFDWKDKFQKDKLTNPDGPEGNFCVGNENSSYSSFDWLNLNDSKFTDDIKKKINPISKDIVKQVYNKVVNEHLNELNVEEKDILKICSYQLATPGDYSKYDQIYILNLPLDYKYFGYKNDGTFEQLPSNVVGSGLDFFESMDCDKVLGVQLQDGKIINNSVYGSRQNDNGYFKFYSKEYNKYGSLIIDDDIDVYDDCEAFLGSDLINELRSYMLYVKIAVPILLIVLCSIDFGKAIIASDEEAMKKAQKRFIQRLIIGIVIFFIPAFINILLNITSDIWNIGGNCEISF